MTKYFHYHPDDILPLLKDFTPSDNTASDDFSIQSLPHDSSIECFKFVPINNIINSEPLNQKDREYIDKLKKLILENTELPPVILGFTSVVKTGEKYNFGIMDGHHRFIAYKESGVNLVPSAIVTSREDYREKTDDPNFLNVFKNHLQENVIRKIINQKLKSILLEFTSDTFQGFTFNTEHLGYHHQQSDMHVDMLKDRIKIAYADYSIYNNKIQIKYIESLEKGKGYGSLLMQYLAKEYGYENIERGSFTEDGWKMRQKLDKLYNFNYEEHINKHLQPEIINSISIKHPIVADFLRDMTTIGYEPTWEKWIDNGKLSKDIDWNDISEIALWIRGSKYNTNSIEEEPPHWVIELVDQLIN